MEDKRNAHKVLPFEPVVKKVNVGNENSVTSTKGHISFWIYESFDQILNYLIFG